MTLIVALFTRLISRYTDTNQSNQAGEEGMKARLLALKRTSNVLVVGGVLILLASAATRLLAPGWSVPAATQNGSGPVEGAEHKPTATDAREAIRGLFDRIYAGLDEGRVEDVAPLVSADIAKSPQSLDYLCQPFTHRAHYLASVVSRPDGVFIARERVVFKPFTEKARIMTFKQSGGNLYLTSAQDDYLNLERQEAKETVRQFIFAARAGRWETVSRSSSPSLPIDILKEPAWEQYLSKINGVEVPGDPTIERNDDGVLLLNVDVELKTHSWSTDFWVDPSTGKIVPSCLSSARKEASLDRLGNTKA
jgi:hypothetical protein